VPRKTANANNGREFTSILPNDDVLFLVFAAPRLCQIAFEIRKQECALAIGLRALAAPTTLTLRGFGRSIPRRICCRIFVGHTATALVAVLQLLTDRFSPTVQPPPSPGC
jgi:hypothetical protein